ncbi:MAG: nitroreductase family deazaflavin-dependent oxidoreductase [Alphaproteobacteria bacterium]|nr:nitroreductase family deazaflavin-dependent oxidoreductase [Alphaproteobacteria bacterium]
MRTYLESGGKEGHMFDAGPGNSPLPSLLLTTVGRKSGKKRMTPLIYGVFGGNHIIVGSKGGSQTHTGWYFNLLENPAAEIQVATEHFKVRARIATGDERAQIWAHMLTVFPTYGDYQKKTTREIPVVVLEKQSA